MLGPIGMQELIIIFVIALIVFGPRKLPQLGKSLGRSIAEFKRASNELRSTLEQEIRVEETRKEIMDPIETLNSEAEEVIKEATNFETDIATNKQSSSSDADTTVSADSNNNQIENPSDTNPSPELEHSADPDTQGRASQKATENKA